MNRRDLSLLLIVTMTLISLLLSGCVPAGDVSGTVIDSKTGRPISGALVRIASKSAVTDENGLWEIKGVSAQAHEVTASKADHVTSTSAIVVEEGSNTLLIEMSLAPGFAKTVISGRLIGDGVYPVEGIRVKLIKDGQLITEVLAAADGSYVLNEIVLPIGDDIDYFLAPQSYRDKESFYHEGHIPLKISANTPYQYILDDYTMPVTSCVHIIVKQAGKALSNAHGYLSIKRRLGSSGRAFMTSEDGDVYIPVGNDADVDITVSIDGFQDTVFKSETLIYRQTKELEIRL